MKRYQGVSLPKELLIRVDFAIDGMGYSSTTDFIKQAVRKDLDRLEKQRRGN
jgi:metal-responsive CopG/Arc/MetJ family transcriptional regulator